jgi:hypothetical protein
MFDEYRINLALFERADNPQFDRSRWGVVFWDDDYFLMVRRDSPNRPILERLEYRFFLPGVALDVVRDQRELADLVREIERNQAARRFPSKQLAGALGVLRRRLADTAAR